MIKITSGDIKHFFSRLYSFAELHIFIDRDVLKREW